jgi:hypothetical protein
MAKRVDLAMNVRDDPDTHRIGQAGAAARA